MDKRSHGARTFEQELEWTEEPALWGWGQSSEYRGSEKGMTLAPQTNSQRVPVAGAQEQGVESKKGWRVQQAPGDTGSGDTRKCSSLGLSRQCGFLDKC